MPSYLAFLFSKLSLGHNDASPAPDPLGLDSAPKDDTPTQCKAVTRTSQVDEVKAEDEDEHVHDASNASPEAEPVNKAEGSKSQDVEDKNKLSAVDINTHTPSAEDAFDQVRQLPKQPLSSLKGTDVAIMEDEKLSSEVEEQDNTPGKVKKIIATEVMNTEGQHGNAK